MIVPESDQKLGLCMPSPPISVDLCAVINTVIHLACAMLVVVCVAGSMGFGTDPQQQSPILQIGPRWRGQPRLCEATGRSESFQLEGQGGRNCASVPHPVALMFAEMWHELAHVRQEGNCTHVCRTLDDASFLHFDEGSGDGRNNSDGDGGDLALGLADSMAPRSPWWAVAVVGVVAIVAAACGFIFVDDDRVDRCAEWCLCYRKKGARAKEYTGKNLFLSEGWQRLHGRGMSSEFTYWVRTMTPEEAERKVSHSDNLVGYITDTRDSSGVFLCKSGGTILTGLDGVPDSWTIHIWRPSTRRTSLGLDASRRITTRTSSYSMDAEALVTTLRKPQTEIRQHSESNRQWPTANSFRPLGEGSIFDRQPNKSC